jgi:hypothetical protein
VTVNHKDAKSLVFFRERRFVHHFSSWESSVIDAGRTDRSSYPARKMRFAR